MILEQILEDKNIPDDEEKLKLEKLLLPKSKEIESKLSSKIAKIVLEQVLEDTNIPHNKKKLIFKEQLLPKIKEIEPEIEPELSSEITKMILKLDNNEILQLIDNKKALKERIDETKHILREFGYEI